MPSAAKRLTILRLLAVAGVGAALLLAVFGLPYGASNPEAFAHLYTHPASGNTLHLHIDADTTNGTRPCDPIDATATVVVGAVHKVGVCLEDYPPNSVEAFELFISSNDSLNFAPDPQGIEDQNGEGGLDHWNCSDWMDNDGDTKIDLADEECIGATTATSLDDNPDANDGDDPTGFKLGGGWDCTGIRLAPPRSEVLPIHLVCFADFWNPDKDLSANPGLLATVEFTAMNQGTDIIDFRPIYTAVGYPLPGGELARCGTPPRAEQSMGCFGATITKTIGADSDGDGMPDWYEELHPCLDPDVPDGTADPDGDGLQNLTEYDLGTDPCDSDTDNDGLSDGAEVNTYVTDPLDSDTDNDGLSDGTEVNTYGTDPLDSDTDDDGLNDATEVSLGSDPLDPDTDDDTVLDGADNCLFIANTDQTDTDGDGPGNACDPDDDNDGLSDSDETSVYGTDPLDSDSDNDGLNDGFEVSIGTNPALADTDGDGFSDREERSLGSDPLVNGSRPEHNSVAGTCTDTQDNDLDTLVDAADPGCVGGPPPPDVTINTGVGGSMPDGTPAGIRGWATTVTKTATAVSVQITVAQVDGVPPVIQGLMTDTSGGAGTAWAFTYTPPYQWPPQSMTSVTMCLDTDGDGQYDDGCQVTGIFLIDPSGVVSVADTGTPIAGATVTLERLNPVQSTYLEMSPTLHAGMFEPEVNPQTTGEDGRYAWDTVPGTYRVQVEKEGCQTATSSSVTVPPPVTYLDVGLTCPDTDSDGLKDYREIEVGTSPTDPDTDDDGALDGSDDCALLANPGQENADSQIGNGKGIPGHDSTVPNSAGDLEGDACETDGDIDNDGIPNASDPDPGGDITYDDNNNGVMCPTDAEDDGPSWDSNCDGKREGWVGACGSTSADADGDGLKDAWENCKWGTNPAVLDSDADTLGDCKEAADVDGNGVVNFTGDVIAYAKAILLAPTVFGHDGDFDIDGNNVLNFPGDVIQEAKFGLLTELCK